MTEEQYKKALGLMACINHCLSYGDFYGCRSCRGESWFYDHTGNCKDRLKIEVFNLLGDIAKDYEMSKLREDIQGDRYRK